MFCRVFFQLGCTLSNTPSISHSINSILMVFLLALVNKENSRSAVFGFEANEDDKPVNMTKLILRAVYGTCMVVGLFEKNI